MISIEKLKKYTPILLVFILTTGATATYMQHYNFNKQATIKITDNHYQAELYSDTETTTKVTILDFGEIVLGDPSNEGYVETSEMYLYLPLLESGDSAYAQWSCSNLPTGMTLVGYYDNNFNGELFEWNENSNTNEITSGENKFRIRFRLYYGDASVGDYDFQVDVSIGEVV